MSTFMLLGAFAIEGQYICTAVLILICSLSGVNLYLSSRKKRQEADGNSEILQETVCVDADDAENVEDEQDRDEGIIVLPLPNGKTIRGRYNKSFTAKLIQSADEIKTYYAELANCILSYNKVKNRISWANSSFYMGRKTVSKFAIKGKTLYLYLALDPQEFTHTKYYGSDESDVKHYQAVPLRVKVKSERGVRFAKELINILAERSGLIRAEYDAETVRASDYPYDTTKNLLARGLIKLKTDGGEILSDEDRLIWAEFERRESVSASEVQNLISDEVAAALIDEKEDRVLSRPKGIINIDTLSQHYQANDTVTLKSLKEKRLIAHSVNYVKVLARGILDKPLTVEANSFSIDAVKMIVLVGGKAKVLRSTKEQKRQRLRPTILRKE